MDVAGKVLAEMLKILEDQFMELDGRNISLLLKDVPRDVQIYLSARHSTIMEMQNQALTRIVTFRGLVRLVNI